jgi:hypothetical protein
VTSRRNPTDQQLGRCGPPIWTVGGDGDLRAGHVDRVGPVRLGQPVEQQPQRRDPPRADRELDVGEQRGAGQLPSEVAGVGAQPDPPGPGGGGQCRERATQQFGGVAAGILIAGQQVCSQHGRGVGPCGTCGRPVRWPWWVVGHPALVSAVDLDIGGIQVDRHPRAQRRGLIQWQRGQRGRGDVTELGLHSAPLHGGQPPRQSGRGRRAQSRHRRQLLAGEVGALAVQPHQEVLPGQLRRGHPDQQLSGSVPPAALLDRPDRRVQPTDHIQAVGQLGHRQHP